MMMKIFVLFNQLHHLLFNRLKTTSEVYQKCQKRICTTFSPKLALTVPSLFVHLLLWPHDADFEVCLSIAAVCVLERMLLLDPECRASASETLELPFFNEFRDIEEETEALPYDQTMDNTDLPLDQWKREQQHTCS